MPLYPFGYGLSYTSFAYDNLELSASSIRPGETLQVSFDVTNTGHCAGADVPQIYLNDKFSSTVKPVMELGAFTKIQLEPGETRRVTLEIGPRQMRTLGPDYVWRVEPGDFEVTLGVNAADMRLKASFSVTEE